MLVTLTLDSVALLEQGAMLLLVLHFGFRLG